ncbi:MAG: class I SAM-dependent methyltransferase [Candidatus Omnitrophica bacterium]|nr:class I SAM-dependent methyltransferase [Candidatus Omnitrophota bacterium]
MEDKTLKQKYIDKYFWFLKERDTANSFNKSSDLNSYHQSEIGTAQRHFEDVEVTVSHLYREAHPALGGLSYGGQLYRKLNEIRKISASQVIVEVGGGLGYLAYSFMNQFRADNAGARAPEYVFCDLTLPFVENQRKLNKAGSIFYCQANAETMPFQDCSTDLIIDNENIADFTPVKLNKKIVLDFLNGRLDASLPNDGLVRKSLQWIKLGQIDVSDAMPEFVFNYGAAEFIGEIKRVLKKDGIAFISEYGILQDYPTAVCLHGHVEYNIQFTHLIKIAKALGMSVELLSLLDFLGFDADTEVIDQCSLKYLCVLLKEKGVELPYLAYTKKMLEERFPGFIDHVQGLIFHKISEYSVFHDLKSFHVLLIAKN